jgi:ribosomal protein S12 methylthiotransferase accessory factor
MSSEAGGHFLHTVSTDVGLINRLDEGMASYDHPRLATFYAHGCDTKPVFGVRQQTTSGGIAPDRQSARVAAIGESLERYSANHAPTSRLRYASVTDLDDGWPVIGPDWVDPPHGADRLPQHWVRGTQLTPEGPGLAAWLAASRVFLNGIDFATGLALTTSTGLAFHPDPWRALRSGLLETIERDAVMMSWLTRSISRPLASTLRWSTDHGGEVRFDRAIETYRTYLLDSPTRVPVVFAVVLGQRNQPPVAVGAAAHPDIVLACRRALIEAKQTFDWCRFMIAQHREIPARDDVDDVEQHVAYYLDPDRLAAFDFLDDSSGAAAQRLDLDHPARTTDNVQSQVRALVGSAQRAGLACYSADVTSPDVREAGGWVIRALIPDLYPLTIGAQHRLDHPRVPARTVPNPDPHPFP